MKKLSFKICLFATLLFLALPSCKENNGGKAIEEVEKPTGFPIPYPEGGELITDNRDGKRGNITLKYEAGKHGEIVKFYEAYTKKEGWNRSEFGQGEIPTTTYINLNRGQTISIGPPGAQVGDAVLVSLTAG